MHEPPSKRQITWRCRRGMLELDLLLQGFVARCYDQLTPANRTAFITLLDYPDALLFELLMGKSVTTDPEIARVIEQIRATASC